MAACLVAERKSPHADGVGGGFLTTHLAGFDGGEGEGGGAGLAECTTTHTEDLE